MIPDPRRKKGKPEGKQPPWEPAEPGPVEGPEIPEEPDNVRSPSRPVPKKRPPVNSAEDER